MIHKHSYTNFSFCLFVLFLAISFQLIFIRNIFFIISFYLIFFTIFFFIAKKIVYSLELEYDFILKVSLDGTKNIINNDCIFKISITIVRIPNIVFYYKNNLGKIKKVELATSDRVDLKKIYYHYKNLNKEIIIYPKEKENNIFYK